MHKGMIVRTNDKKIGDVLVTEGQYEIGGRISNHFKWRKILKDGSLGKKEYKGYGGPEGEDVTEHYEVKYLKIENAEEKLEKKRLLEEINHLHSTALYTVKRARDNGLSAIERAKENGVSLMDMRDVIDVVRNNNLKLIEIKRRKK